ncbi:MAG: DnaJ domain-containing protein [Brevinematales bacterium]|nr:DnaJ domain-containing protein [Brevinematales bacterium]
MKTYYDILGISNEANVKEIKRAFRELAKRFHPDVGKQKGKDYSKIFEEITVAYSILSDEEKRKIYDESLKKTQKPNFLANFNFKEIFNLKIVEDFFRKKVSSNYNDKDFENLSIQELIDRIIFSRNIYVQKYAVTLILAKKKLYAVRDLLRLLYSNINEEVKLFIIEEIKRKRLTKKVKEVLKEIYEIEKNPSVREAIYCCFE